MRSRNEQTPCRHCGRYYNRRGIANHERHCGPPNSSPRSTNSVSSKGQALGNAFESVTSMDCWTSNPCRTLGQTFLLFILCGLIRELISTGLGFVAEKGLAGSEETIREGLTAVMTTWMRISKQTKANIRLEEQQPQEPQDDKSPN